MPRAPAHCRYKGRLLEGILNIPADTRFAFGNKKQFLANLHTSDPVQAAALIGPLVREWKGRIASVRAGLHDPQRDMIDTLAARYRKLHDPMSDADARLVADAIDFVFQRIGGATAIEQAKALADARGDVPEALQTTPHARRAVNALNQIARPGDAVTPFLTYLERWEATLSKTKVHAAWIAILKEFDLAVGQPLEALAGHHVQRWIDDLLSRVSPVTGTVQNRRPDRLLEVPRQPPDRRWRAQPIQGSPNQIPEIQGRARRTEASRLPAKRDTGSMGASGARRRLRTELRDPTVERHGLALGRGVPAQNR